jgi:hypothetical protein
MDLARTFDLSKSQRYTPEEQEKASIPVLAALFRRSDVKDGLVQGAEEWVSGIGPRIHGSELSRWR